MKTDEALLEAVREFLAPTLKPGEDVSRHFETFPQVVDDAREWLKASKSLGGYSPTNAGGVTDRIAAAFLQQQENAGWWGRFASAAVGARKKAEAESAALREQVERLKAEVDSLSVHPYCSSCHCALGDSWCAQCAGAALRELVADLAPALEALAKYHPSDSCHQINEVLRLGRRAAKLATGGS